jgi:hypothetical protein
MDLTKLPPAPWKVECDRDGGHYIPHHGRFPMLLPECEVEADLAALYFAALARNAFDVMMRRGWNSSVDVQGKWFVVDRHNRPVHHADEHGNPVRLADPFTALVEADKWYVENVENRK